VLLFTFGGLGLVTLVLVLRIWSWLHHWLVSVQKHLSIGLSHTRRGRTLSKLQNPEHKTTADCANTGFDSSLSKCGRVVCGLLLYHNTVDTV